ncbi:hypothetical protein G5B38_15060 [Pseudohalocynthiibacter aestuariivivens]|uniref:Uncharacterized protein n=1 Tax=Roseovarius pelagicus TaxID=2980108 RepID=A0ABY6DF03_9RHOB|nr:MULTISPECIES: hypothetical protein [Rhodobacterales]QIE46735.1 hypothetical protein G5B38_15060 [Pseudohalocynthiibacter aestuariivivens]UXX84727.1 hypothetical protein N7U68_08860 [Roseovarius pelagicus]
MTYSQNGFSTRLRKVQRTHVRMARGYDSKVGADGLIVFRPKRRKMSFPLRGFVLMIMGVLLFKGLIMAQSGADAYAARIAVLEQGTVLEQAGAVLMYADPVTQAIATKAAPLFW